MIYRSLTGTMPPEAYGRQKNDNTLTIQKINPSIPLELSDAISKGMSYRADARYDSVRPILELLQRAKSVAIIPKGIEKEIAPPPPGPEKKERVSAVRSYETVRPRRKKAKKRRRFPYGIVSFFVSLVLIGAVAAMLFYDLYGEKVDKAFGWNFYSQQNLGQGEALNPPAPSQYEPSTDEEESETRKQVPVFIGQVSQAVLENGDYTALFAFQVQESESNLYGPGVVIDQNPTPGSFVDYDGTPVPVTIVVSVGGQTVKVPDIVGKNIADAVPLLTERGIQYDTVYVYDNDAEEGIVLRMDFPAETEIDPSVSLTVYVAKSYETEEPEESEETGDEE